MTPLDGIRGTRRVGGADGDRDVLQRADGRGRDQPTRRATSSAAGAARAGSTARLARPLGHREQPALATGRHASARTTDRVAGPQRAENLALLRRLALAHLERLDLKKSIKKKRYAAAFSTDVLETWFSLLLICVVLAVCDAFTLPAPPAGDVGNRLQLLDFLLASGVVAFLENQPPRLARRTGKRSTRGSATWDAFHSEPLTSRSAARVVLGITCGKQGKFAEVLVQLSAAIDSLSKTKLTPEQVVQRHLLPRNTFLLDQNERGRDNSTVATTVKQETIRWSSRSRFPKSLLTAFAPSAVSCRGCWNWACASGRPARHRARHVAGVSRRPCRPQGDPGVAAVRGIPGAPGGVGRKSSRCPLSDEENREWEKYELIEHVVCLAKTRAAGNQPGERMPKEEIRAASPARPRTGAGLLRVLPRPHASRTRSIGWITSSPRNTAA